jgi:hypothetical protein
MSLLRSFSLPGSGAGSEINELLHSRACASSIHFAGTKYWISSSSLVRSVSDDDEEDAQQQPVTDSDTVMDEVDRWSKLDKVTIKEFRDDAGIVNEFALLCKLRGAFPLHYTVFKQTAAHIPHEGNSEQLFSRSGALSDSNGKMDPARLAVWTSIGVNYSTFQPSDKQILERYLLKFGAGGKAANLHEDDLGLLDADSIEGASTSGGEVYVQTTDGE